MKKIMSIFLIIIVTVGAFAGVSLGSDNTDSVASETEALSVTQTLETQDSESDSASETEVTEMTAEADFLEAVDKAKDKDYPDESTEIGSVIQFQGDSAVVEGEGVEITDSGIVITEGGTYALSGLYTKQVKVDVGDEDVQLILAGVTLENDSVSPILIEQADETTITLKSGTVNTITDTSPYVESDTDDKTNASIYSKDDLAVNGEGTLIIDAQDKSGIIGKDDVVVLSGNIEITALHNGIKGKDVLYVGGGNLKIDAGTDGMESEVVVYIEGGNIVVGQSYEGIEALDIVIEDGYIEIHAEDDGVNISGEILEDESTDAQSEQSGFGGPGMDEVLTGHGLTINGGTLVVYSDGDGLDSNGDIWMMGGDVFVYGPTNSGNGSIDYNGSFEMLGGSIVAAGSMGMVQTPDDTSETYILNIGLDTTYEAGTIVTVEDASGNSVLEFIGQKRFQSIVLSSEEIQLGQTYTVTVDGTVLDTQTVEDTITTIGTVSSRGGGGHGGFGNRPENGSGRPPQRNGEMPEGFEPPEGSEAPEGFEPPEDMSQTEIEDNTLETVAVVSE